MASPGAMPAACGLKIIMACIPSRIPALSDSRSPPSMLLSLGYLPEAEAYAGYSQRLKQYNGEGRVKSCLISFRVGLEKVRRWTILVNSWTNSNGDEK